MATVPNCSNSPQDTYLLQTPSCYDRPRSATHTYAPVECSSQNIISRPLYDASRETSPLTTSQLLFDIILSGTNDSHKTTNSNHLAQFEVDRLQSCRIPDNPHLRQWPHLKYAVLGQLSVSCPPLPCQLDSQPRGPDVLIPSLLQEMQQSSRPLTQHPASLPGRQSHTRTSSHSLLTGSLNANHRITRRKSVTNPGSNVAAIAAALRDGEHSAAMPIVQGRRNTMSKSAAARAAIVGSLPSPPASLPTRKSMSDAKGELHGSAIEDDSNDASADDADKFQKARMRRASDGQPLMKEGKKSNRVEVRCDKCGKGYKHSSCLTKHLLVPPPTLDSRWPFVFRERSFGSLHRHRRVVMCV